MTIEDSRKLGELRKRVEEFATLPTTNTNKSMINLPSLPKINTDSPFFYLIPPIIILIVLMVIKPPFITTDQIDKDNVITKRINIKKLIIAVLLAGIFIDVALFAYLKKKILFNK